MSFNRLYEIMGARRLVAATGAGPRQGVQHGGNEPLVNPDQTADEEFHGSL